jgi:hypothetical protein
MQAICDCGFATMQILPRFNRYEGASIIASTSRLIALRTTRDTRPVIEGCYSGPAYTADV